MQGFRTSHRPADLAQRGGTLNSVVVSTTRRGHEAVCTNFPQLATSFNIISQVSFAIKLCPCPNKQSSFKQKPLQSLGKPARNRISHPTQFWVICNFVCVLRQFVRILRISTFGPRTNLVFKSQKPLKPSVSPKNYRQTSKKGSNLSLAKNECYSLKLDTTHTQSPSKTQSVRWSASGTRWRTSQRHWKRRRSSRPRRLGENVEVVLDHRVTRRFFFLESLFWGE